MSTELENLNLEEGKSDALRAVLAGIAESTSIDGGPRYSDKVCRGLARIIVCRNYAKPLLELSHLLVAVSAGHGRYEDVFWGISRASSAEFRRSFLAFEGNSEGIEITHAGIRHSDGADAFEISYGRMPLLAALLEFMIMALGYSAIDKMTGGLRREKPGHAAVLEAARDLQRSLYAYLKENLPAVQRQRRERHFLTYIDAHAGNRTGSNAIRDDVLLGYWQAYAASDEIEAKTFRSVYDTARKLIAVLDAARERLSGSHAKSIGTDIEAGEVDPADVEAVSGAIDDDDEPLLRLLGTCGEHVKFVNVSEMETLSELPLGESTARHIPISVLRNAVFGAVQLRISTALRRGGPAHVVLPDAADGFYAARLKDYANVISGTEKIAQAALWALHQAGRVEALDLALALAPDIDWGQLAAAAAKEEDDNIVSLAAQGAMKQFFAHRPDARGDEISALLADARRAWRAVNRTGFRDENDADSLQAMAAAVPDVLRLIQAVQRILGRDLGHVDWPSFEAADADTFAAMFRSLYDLGEEADSHAR